MTIDRVILIILDSVGAGAAPDAADYSDEGAATLANTARHVDGLRLPNLQRLGLGNIVPIEGVGKMATSQGAFGKMAQSTAGKDSACGHWELAGLALRRPLPTFPNGLPVEIVDELTRQTGRRVVGNVAMSCAAMLQAFGEQHVASHGQWIVTTSADSVVHIATHEDVVPLEELYDACQTARDILDPLRVGRVVACPFKGPRDGQFELTRRRRDFTLMPPRETVLDKCHDYGLPVIGIGRIDDLFCGQGLDESLPTRGNTDGMIKTVETMTRLERGLVVTNLGDFDTHGHARDPEGYAHCLEEFDVQLAMLLSRSRDTDLMLLTADHGNDPTRPGSDHSREYVPILAAGPSKAAGVDLGTRSSLADVGATIAEVFGVEAPETGESFLGEIS